MPPPPAEGMGGASRKRSFSQGGSCWPPAVPAAWQPQHDDQPPGDQAKRCCGSGAGQLPDADVAAVMHRLSPHLPADPAALVPLTGLDAAGWRSFAEVNALMAAHFRGLQSGTLASFRSFVAQPRAGLWLRYAAACGVADADARAPAPPPPQAYAAAAPHLALVRFLLEMVLHAYPDASLTEYGIRLPSWMVGYASRWGLLSEGGVVNLVVLQAYPASDPCCSRAASSSRLPALSVYVPVAPARRGAARGE